MCAQRERRRFGESCDLKSIEERVFKKVVWLFVPNVINRSSKSYLRTDH